MRASASTAGQKWRVLYRAALLEVDEQKLPSRIVEAERALVLRERELFALSGDNIEQQAVSTARYALQALRSCVELRTRAAAA